MKNINFSYIIERYNAGEMSDSDKQSFEKKLINDKMLRDEANLRRKTDEILENQNIISLRNKLTSIEKRRESKKHIISTKMPVYLKYAAVILGIILIGNLSLFRGKNLSGDEIINRYYKVYEPPTTSRSSVTEPNSDFTMALEFYNTHEYGKAAALFSKVVESNPKDMQSEFLSGLSNFEDKKYPEAKQSFANVISENENYFIETAKWYLALCYVKTNEKEKAIQQLEIIKKEGGLYSKDAKNIIKRYK
jgi:TolA-binding protein